VLTKPLIVIAINFPFPSVFEQTFDLKSNEYHGQSREHFKRLTVEQANQAIDEFTNQLPHHRRSIVHHFLSKLEQLEQWFDRDNQNRFEFISSSLLFAYSSDEQDELHIELRMIDFAHVFPLAGSKCLVEGMAHQDQNYLFGLRNLLQLFQKLARK
jgi:hypothetical protein